MDGVTPDGTQIWILACRIRCIALPIGSAKTTAVPALVAWHYSALVIVVIPSATKAEAMAAYMKKEPFAQGDPPVAFSAQKAYVHPTNEEPSLARRVGSASVV